MSEFEEKLNALLGDPEAMAQVAALAQSLSGEGGASASSGAAEGADAEVLAQLGPLLGALKSGASETTALLRALKPFLSEERRAKVDRAALYARLLHLGKTMLTQEDASV